MALNNFKRAVNPLLISLGKIKERYKFSEIPILIGGCGRSGTTLLLSIIGAHPSIYAFKKELGVFIEWHDSVTLLNRGSKETVPRLDRLYRNILKAKVPAEADRWCEKTPRNIRYFGDILDYFNQEVKLIHIIRDGWDVMLSEHPTAPGKYWVNPDRWITDVKAGLEYKDHPQVLTIKYEDLILSYRDTIEEVCEFIGEECTEELYSWVEHTNVKKNKAWDGRVKELHSESIGKWKKEENKERVEEVMQHEEVRELLAELGYEV